MDYKLRRLDISVLNAGIMMIYIIDNFKSIDYYYKRLFTHGVL